MPGTSELGVQGLQGAHALPLIWQELQMHIAVSKYERNFHKIILTLLSICLY